MQKSIFTLALAGIIFIAATQAMAGNYFGLCDRYSAHPDDPDKPACLEDGARTFEEADKAARSTGVGDINSSLVADLCKRAAETLQKSPLPHSYASGCNAGTTATEMRRFYFQYGRVLEFQGKLEEAKQAYKKAANVGSVIAAKSLEKIKN